ncbi:FUN14 domain-containing protein 1 [Aplysia californica]|uniref:FUN14 domain-containing protein 1 n=1 Tax=Aplysia californica TaxID=6500 RepID=A0ABM0K1W6_APLCA|nr:FUN14 domain-containing protein 1 [Aplysia californica]
MASVRSQVQEISEELVEGDYILIDSEPSGKLSSVQHMILGDITKQSAAKQVFIGGATGWVSGYLAKQVGKTAAIAVGGSILLIQLAQYNGYITVDWTKVRRALTRARAQAEKEYRKRHSSYFESARRFYQDNFFLATGFAGGLLGGLFI